MKTLLPRTVRVAAVCLAWLFAVSPSLAADEGKPVQRLGDLRGVWRTNFNHDASRIVTRLRGGLMGLWDAETGARIDCELGADTRATVCHMSPDARMVLVAFEKGGARVFDARSGAAISPPLDAVVQAWYQPPACFAPDGKTVLVIAGASALVFNIHSGRRIAALDLSAMADKSFGEGHAQAQFTDDGTSCFLMDYAGTVTRYETAHWLPQGKPMAHPHPESWIAFAASGDGKWAATFDSPGDHGSIGKLQLWDTTRGAPLGEPLESRDGLKCRFLGYTNRVLVMPARGEASVRELPSMKLVFAIRPHDDVYGSEIAVSPDGNWLMSWGSDRMLTLYDAHTGVFARNFSSGAKPERVLFAPDSSACFVTFTNTAFFADRFHDNYVGKFTLPKLAKSELIRILDTLAEEKLSPDGRRLMIRQGWTDRERVVLYDAATMKPVEWAKP